MAQIHSEPVWKGLGPVVPGALLAARTAAARLLDEAHQEAQAVRARAEVAARETLAAARAAGEEAAREAAVRQLQQAEAQALAQAARLAEAAAPAVLAVAERVWRRPPADPAAAARAVALEILDELDGRAVLELRVPPAVVPQVQELAPRVVADASLGPGDCVVVGPEGSHDGRAPVRARLALDVLAATLSGPLALGPSPLEEAA